MSAIDDLERELIYLRGVLDYIQWQLEPVRRPSGGTLAQLLEKQKAIQAEHAAVLRRLCNAVLGKAGGVE